MNRIKLLLGSVATLLVLSVSGLAFAQEAATEENVIGSWNADFAAMLAAEELTAEERAAIEGMVAGAAATMSLNADHTASYHAEMMGQVEDKAGTWALDPATSSITIVDSTTAETVVMTVAVPDATTLILTTPEGDSMVWRRTAAE